MNDLNSPAKRMTMKSIPIVRHGFVGKVRLIAGIAITVAGAFVLLADTIRLPGLFL